MKLLKLSREGLLDWQIPIKGFVEYCKRWWPGASEHKKTYRVIRDRLQNFDIYEVDKSQQEWHVGNGHGYTRDIPILKGIDFYKLLLFYEAIEIMLRKKCVVEEDPFLEFFDMMPDHRGYCAVMIFEAVFKKLLFHRTRDEIRGRMETETTLREVVEEDAEEEIPVPPLERVNSAMRMEAWNSLTIEEKLRDQTFWSQCVLAKLRRKAQGLVRQLKLDLNILH
ncbi:MAG: hypothetical protein F6K47_15890 [Symploca sp. SIO2E6]|nr:hypothetical protein [Symploca sp. SIO2E6]